MSDRIVLAGISAETLVGVHEHERHALRPITIDLELICDLAAAAASDRLDDTIDYAAVTSRVRERCRAARHLLVEALAGELAQTCLEDARVLAVKVTLHKPGALPGVADVAVVLERSRGSR